MENVVFEPYIGELGHEICKWSGDVRFLCKKFEKSIVFTRKDRMDLYTGIASEIKTFEIENDYIDSNPNKSFLTFNRKKVVPENVKSLISKINLNYRGYKKFSNNSIFNKNQNKDFNYTPRSKNREIVDKIFNGCREKVITIATRHKKQSPGRNWLKENWEELIERILENKNCSVIIVGIKNCSYVPKSRNNLYFLSDFIEEGTSGIGLTIEVLRKTNIFAGPQSGIGMLANIIKTPITIIWGMRKGRMEEDNFCKNKFIHIICDGSTKGYVITPSDIYKEIKQYLGGNL